MGCKLYGLFQKARNFSGEALWHKKQLTESPGRWDTGAPQASSAHLWHVPVWNGGKSRTASLKTVSYKNISHLDLKLSDVDMFTATVDWKHWLVTHIFLSTAQKFCHNISIVLISSYCILLYHCQLDRRTSYCQISLRRLHFSKTLSEIPTVCCLSKKLWKGQTKANTVEQQSNGGQKRAWVRANYKQKWNKDEDFE